MGARVPSFIVNDFLTVLFHLGCPWFEGLSQEIYFGFLACTMPKEVNRNLIVVYSAQVMLTCAANRSAPMSKNRKWQEESLRASLCRNSLLRRRAWRRWVEFHGLTPIQAKRTVDWDNQALYNARTYSRQLLRTIFLANPRVLPKDLVHQLEKYFRRLGKGRPNNRPVRLAPESLQSTISAKSIPEKPMSICALHAHRLSKNILAK